MLSAAATQYNILTRREGEREREGGTGTGTGTGQHSTGQDRDRTAQHRTGQDRTERETERQRDRETERLRDWETERLRDWETGRLGDWETGQHSTLAFHALRRGSLLACSYPANKWTGPSRNTVTWTSPSVLAHRCHCTIVVDSLRITEVLN